VYWSCCHHLTLKNQLDRTVSLLKYWRIKEVRHQIAPILTFIYNQSLSSGVLPEDWRTANIFALHKKGPKDLAENYRPISLTSICSKILEHIVYSSISRFLENNSILTPRQHGFRTGHSCESQLLHAINDWAEALDHGYRHNLSVIGKGYTDSEKYTSAHNLFLQVHLNMESSPAAPGYTWAAHLWRPKSPATTKLMLFC